MDGGGDSFGCCFPARKESIQGVCWIVEALALETASSGSEYTRAGESAGAVSALAGQEEHSYFPLRERQGRGHPLPQRPGLLGA